MLEGNREPKLLRPVIEMRLTPGPVDGENADSTGGQRLYRNTRVNMCGVIKVLPPVFF